jgi:N-acetylglucosamine-6-phosphate deacetylase
MRLLIEHAQLFTPQGAWPHGWLLAEDGRIAAMGQGAAPPLDAPRYDAAGCALLPGFIDVHVHGSIGHEAMDATPEALDALARHFARHGVTGFLATTWTDAPDRIDAALRSAAAYRGVSDGAAVLGVHLEGPYLNPAKCGAQNPALIRRAPPDEVTRFLDYGVIRLFALAPEYPEHAAVIEACAARGIAVSAAHTDATYAQMEAAVARGLSQTTHTFNAMSPLSHREPGVVGAAFALDALRCELICDLIHVHAAAVRALWLAKRAEGVLLITDAVRPAGLPDGPYVNDGRPVMVRDGAVRLPDGTLAGSTLTMDAALRNLLAALGGRFTLADVWPAVSLTPARAIGLSARKGSLEVGKDADLVVLDRTLHVAATVVGGRVVFARPAAAETGSAS